MTMIDASFYGVAPVAQPSGDASPMPAPEQTTRIRTAPLPGNLGIFHQAGFWIVALVALAIGLVHVSIRFA